MAQASTKRWLPWVIWGIAASYFFCDYFARVSISVMAGDLIRDFNITGLELGVLSAFFYIPYLAMQIPVGLIVDRFNIRRLLTIMSIVTAIGCVVFGRANGLAMAQAGRLLIGFSAAFAFVSALKLATNWFPSEKLGLIAGFTQALGMLGAAVGDLPVSLLVDKYGWRYTMFIMAVVFVILAGLIYLIVRDKPANESTAIQTNHSIWQSLKIVLSNPQVRWNALYVGFLYAPTAAFAELWGVLYLHHGRGLTEHHAAFANGLIFIGWAFGGPCGGWISDKIGRRKPVMIASAICGVIIFSALLFTPHLSAFRADVLLFLFGFTNVGVAIAYAVSTEVVPKQVVGTSIAFANMASVIIGAALQPVIGWIYDLIRGGAVDTAAQLSHLQTALAILPVCSLLALLCVSRVREPGRSS